MSSEKKSIAPNQKNICLKGLLIYIVPFVLSLSLLFRDYSIAIIFSAVLLAALPGILTGSGKNIKLTSPLIAAGLIALGHALVFESWNFSALTIYISLLFLEAGAGYFIGSIDSSQTEGEIEIQGMQIPSAYISITLFAFLTLFLCAATHIEVSTALWILIPLIPVLTTPRILHYPGLLHIGFFIAVITAVVTALSGSTLYILTTIVSCIFSFSILSKAKRIEKWVLLILIVVLCISMVYSLNAPVSKELPSRIKTYYDTALQNLPMGRGAGTWTQSVLDVLDTKNPGSEKEIFTLPKNPPAIFTLISDLGIFGLIVVFLIFHFSFINFSASITEKNSFYSALRLSTGLSILFYTLAFPKGGISASLATAWLLLSVNYHTPHKNDSSPIYEKKPGPPVFFSVSFTACLVILILVVSIMAKNHTKAKIIKSNISKLRTGLNMDNYTPKSKYIQDLSAQIDLYFERGFIKKDFPSSAYPTMASYLFSMDNTDYAAELFNLAAPRNFEPIDMLEAGRCFMDKNDRSRAFKWLKGAYYFSYDKIAPARELAIFYKSIGQPRQGLSLIENFEKGLFIKELILIKAELCENLSLFERASEIYASGFSVFNNPLFLARAGQACVQNKNFLKAMDYFKMAHFQGDTKAPYRFVEAAVKQGLYAKAEDFIKKNPTSFLKNPSDLNRLEVILKKEVASKVLTTLKEVISENAPSNVKKLKQLVKDLDRIGRYESALHQIDIFFESGGDDPVLRMARAEMLFKSKRFLEAAESFLDNSENINLNKKGILKLYQKVAMAYSQANQHELAIKYGEKAIAMTDGKDIECLNNLAHIYGASGDNKKAEKILVHAANTDPTSSVSYYNLAMCYYKRNMVENAEKAIKNGLKFGKNDFYSTKFQTLAKHLATFKKITASPPETKFQKADTNIKKSE